MSMEMKQKSGDNSQLIQAGTIIINNGITEDRARQIFQEESAKITAYTQEAHSIAYERIHKLEDSFMVASSKIDGALESFADPAFQLLLKDAAERAAATEREEDYDLLSQLLICHIQKGEDRKNRAGIHRAIQIVDEIDNDALCALTVFHAITSFVPEEGSCCKGLKELDELFAKLIYLDLPTGYEWLDHLDILGTIRIDPASKLKALKDIYAVMLNGYVCVGIEKDSEEYKTALKLLGNDQFLIDLLVDNQFLDGYVRLNIPSDRAIDDIIRKRSIHIKGIDAFYDKKLLKKVWSLYSKNESLLLQVKARFASCFEEYKYLKIVSSWFESIQESFVLTTIGRVIAHTNAKRCDPSIPDLI